MSVKWIDTSDYIRIQLLVICTSSECISKQAKYNRYNKGEASKKQRRPWMWLGNMGRDIYDVKGKTNEMKLDIANERIFTIATFNTTVRCVLCVVPLSLPHCQRAISVYGKYFEVEIIFHQKHFQYSRVEWRHRSINTPRPFDAACHCKFCCVFELVFTQLHPMQWVPSPNLQMACADWEAVSFDIFFRKYYVIKCRSKRQASLSHFACDSKQYDIW